MRSSRSIDSTSNALRKWLQPSRRIWVTSAVSRAGSNCVLIASGRVVTWLSARKAAKILMRIISMKKAVHSRACLGFGDPRTAFLGSPRPRGAEDLRDPKSLYHSDSKGSLNQRYGRGGGWAFGRGLLPACHESGRGRQALP